jgi:hypothetical protein
MLLGPQLLLLLAAATSLGQVHPNGKPATTSQGRATGAASATSLAPHACTKMGAAPLWWMHVPKSGSSFLNVVFRAGCPNGGLSPKPVKEASWLHKRIRNQGCSQNFSHFQSGHQPLSPATTPRSFVTLFREPLSRALSGFYHNYHDCGDLQKNTGVAGEATYRASVYEPTNRTKLLYYARCTGAW